MTLDITSSLAQQVDPEMIQNFRQPIFELDSVYGQIADELASQYTIGYASKNPRRDGAWRRIDVRVSRPNAAARTKRGYYAPTGR